MAANTPSGGAGEDGRTLLELVDLTKTYQSAVAVERTSLTVRNGEFMTFLGPSGSGKTTTLMMIAGFTPPSSGDILLDGKSIVSSPPERRNIGVVFQNYALFPHMTVSENVAFPLRMRSWKRADIVESVARSLDLVKLSGLGDRLPRQLSGGQQQRVALARAMVFSPRLLLMDEPLGALDKKLREHMQFELKRIHRELGTTIIYVTHDQQEALTMSDRIALMNEGRIEQLGTAQEIYNAPASHFAADFIGESNLLRGQLMSRDSFRDENGTDIPVAGVASTVAVGSPCSVLLRPEDLKIGPDRPAAANALRARVGEHLYVGDHIKYTVSTEAGTTLNVKHPTPKDKNLAGEGDLVWVWWEAGSARLVP
ncbi:MAG: ABC transporter ATP-binding protein [Flavobacteriaceae bacterium]